MGEEVCGRGPPCRKFTLQQYALIARFLPRSPFSTGDFIFFHNSANATHNCYHPGFVILDGADLGSYVQRSSEPLLSPVYDWEIGAAPAECNVGCVVFLEAARAVPGEVDTFDVFFGGSDAVIGTARVRVTKN